MACKNCGTPTFGRYCSGCRGLASSELVAPKKAVINGEEIEIVERNRFSNFGADMDTLQRWIKWFRARGINAVLARASTKGSAIYRNGLLSD